MKQKKILLIALTIIFLAETIWGADQAIKNGEFWMGTSSCTCKGQLNASALYKSTYLESDALASEHAINLSHEQCARSCGGNTTCSSDDNAKCASCCTTDCSAIDTSVRDKCELSCSSTCSYRGLVNGVIGIIYIAAGILGALMIVIHGIKMVTAQDPNDRNAAKNSIIYVIIALVIIVLAGALIGLFLQHGTIPSI